MVRISILFIVSFMYLSQCSIKKGANNDTLKCNYKINSIENINEELFFEMGKYVKSYMTHNSSKDKYIVMWNDENKGKTIYSFSYSIDIDEHIIDTTYSIYHFNNQFIVFIISPNIKDLKMEKCSVIEIVRKYFPDKYNDYQNGVISITNIEDLPVYELTFKDNVLIKKRIYFQ